MRSYAVERCKMNSMSFNKIISLASRLSWRQLRAESYFTIAMIANMALGLTGYLAVDGFNRSFLHEVDARSKQLAGGDLVIS